MAGKPNLASRSFLFAGSLLLTVGVALIVIGLAVWRISPYKSLHITFLQVWGTVGAATAIAGILVSGLPRRPTTTSKRTRAARIAALAGGLALLTLVYFVMVDITPNRDGTVSEAAIYVTVPMGVIAGAIGAWGAASARGDRVSLRWSLAALIIGVTALALPIWLKWTAPSLFSSYYGS